MASFTCEAKFDYDATKEDELSFKTGNMILNVTCHADGGWWEGEFEGKKGWFPDNFVEKVATKTAAPAPPPGKPAGGNGGQKAKVTFDYDAANADELNLKVGQ